MRLALVCCFLHAAACSAADPLPVVYGRPSFVVENAGVEVSLTELGGHMVATFEPNAATPIRPYYVSPWQAEGRKLDPPLLTVLRGDFFCLPFGGNAEEFRGEKHPPHGEAANSTWSVVSQSRKNGVARLTLSLETKVRPGKVTKEITLIDGEPVIYSRHTIEGFVGPTPVAHHATLRLPEREGALRVATSPIRFGITNPTLFSDPVKGEYQSLAIGAKFAELTKVPQIFKDAPDADGTRFPARRGFADFFCVANRSSGKANEPAWVAAVNNDDHSLWFALKDPAVLPMTAFWIENRGRHGEPWLGRNNCLGLEDICAYFADGLTPSARENLLTKEGVPTTIELHADKPTEIRYIQGAFRVPEGFESVAGVEFSPGKVKFLNPDGGEVTVGVRHEFLFDGKLEASKP